MEIDIDNFTFKLISYDLEYADGRGALKIVSINKQTKEETPFTVYSSKSELGFWRLCQKKDPYYKNNNLFKGSYDYIQQTFIHLELQIFIDKNKDKIIIKNNKKYLDPLHADRLDGKDKEEYLQYFENKEEYDIDPCSVSIEMQSFIDNEERKIMIEPFSSIRNKCGEYNYFTGINKNTVRDFSTILEKYYNYNNVSFINCYNKEIIIEHTKNYYEELIYTAIITGKIFSVNLNHKTDTNNNVILYFIKYNLEIRGSTESNYSKAPINNLNVIDKYAPIILIQNNTITKYGIYSKYVYAGIYICKILDYWEQCKSHDRCSKQYSYIGDIYDGVFPYNKIDEENKPVSVSVYNFKYKKYKMKYLNLKNKYLQLKNTN